VLDQIFVTSLDAAPRESDVLSGLASIDAGEITADQIQVANLKITNEVTATCRQVQFAGTTNVNPSSRRHRLVLVRITQLTIFNWYI